MYVKTDLLGKGTFGIVYKGFDDHDNVAIKHYMNIKNKDIPYQILREINNMRLLKHHNIIDLKYVIQKNDNIELIMEYGGENLRTYYLSKTNNERINEIKSIAYQIITGFLYMHKLNIVHRDIKPENILIKNGEIKICDFGLTKKITTNENNSYQVGTLQYKPPELFSTNLNYDSSIDVWSIGCLLYEFVMGYQLFKGTTEITILQNILSKIPTKQSDLDEVGIDYYRIDKCNNSDEYKIEFNDELIDLFNLIKKMIVISPSKRITLSDAIKSSFFDNFTSCKEIDMDILINNTIITNSQEFFVRKKQSKKLKNLRLPQIELMLNYNLDKQTTLSAINCFDMFCYLIKGQLKNQLNIPKIIENIELIALSCLMISSKFIDLQPLTIKKIIKLTKYDELSIIYWERIILRIINYDLNQPTLIDIYPNVSWDIICSVIKNYDLLINKGLSEIKEILIGEVRNSK